MNDFRYRGSVQDSRQVGLFLMQVDLGDFDREYRHRQLREIPDIASTDVMY